MEEKIELVQHKKEDLEEALLHKENPGLMESNIGGLTKEQKYEDPTRCPVCLSSKMTDYVHFSDMYALHLDFLNLCSNDECPRYYDQCRMSWYKE